MMSEFKEFLLALPREQLWLIGGVIAEVMLQLIKRYLWQPPDYEKAKKLLAAALVSLVLALGTNAAGGIGHTCHGQLLALWLGIFISAIGFHETTDKLGLKRAWAELLR